MALPWVAKLLDVGLVTEAQLRAADVDAPQSRSAEVMQRLIARGLDERAVAGLFVSLGFGPVLQSRELARADHELIERLPGPEAHELCALPLRPSPAGAVVAMADPTDERAVTRLSKHLGGTILPTVAKLSDLLDALDSAYPAHRPTVVSDATTSRRERRPSGVVPLGQEATADGALPELEPQLAQLAETASPVWDRAWDHSAAHGSPASPPPATPSRADATAPPPPRSVPVGSCPTLRVDKLAQTTNRDEVVRGGCELCLDAASGAVFLALRKGVFRGWDGAGSHVTSASIRTLWVPASNPSVLSDVAHADKPFRGPHGQTAADHLLRAALGGASGEILVLPVRIDHRICGLLCVTEPASDSEAFEAVADAMGQAFARLIRWHKTERLS